MAPKRSAPPPPPPPVDSSEETASGSDNESSSEEIAYSPPSANPPPKQTAPPPQKVQQPEASDDEYEDEEEEEEAEKANHTVPSSAPQNPPRPRPEPEESESGEEEEEEGTDDEARQQVSAPKTAEGKKPTAPFQRYWSKDDEVRILEAVAAHRRKHRTLPQPEDLAAALAGSLDNSDYSLKELAGKLKSLRTKYTKTLKKVDLPSNDLDRRIFELLKEVWGGGGGGGGGGDRPANGTVRRERREFGEMCQMYPYLAEEVNALERTHPGLFKREFGMMDDDKARALDQKIKKQRVLQMKLELRQLDMTKEVTKMLMSLAESE